MAKKQRGRMVTQTLEHRDKTVPRERYVQWRTVYRYAQRAWDADGAQVRCRSRRGQNWRYVDDVSHSARHPRFTVPRTGA